MKNKKSSKNYVGVLSSLFAIVIGLLVGFIVLLLCNSRQALPGFATILTGSLTHGMKGIGQVFYYATPIILTGLSVGFAFKTGLFNIGSSGQFIVGGFGAVYVGIMMKNLGGVHWIVALLASIVFGAIWGMLPGILKAYFNVSEVISSIMMNYIGMYMVNMLVKNSPRLFDTLRNQSKYPHPNAIIPKMGMNTLFPGSSVNGGIIIALIAVIIIQIVLNKTTFGYELKSVGHNRFASKYAGINENRSIVLSMVISGALAGLGGALLLLAGAGKHIEVLDILPVEGFNGIPVALLGMSHPVGVFFSALFIAHLGRGGFYIQRLNFVPEVITMITASIVYFSAFALVVKSQIGKLTKKFTKNTDGANANSDIPIIQNTKEHIPKEGQ